MTIDVENKLKSIKHKLFMESLADEASSTNLLEAFDEVVEVVEWLVAQQQEGSNP